MNKIYDFPVLRERLNCDDGTYAGRHVIRNKDTGDVLGVVGEGYELLEHEKAIESAEKVLGQIGIGRWDRTKINMTKDGARMRVEYDFPEKEVEIGKLPNNGGPDIVNPRLILTNSYDESLEYGFILGAYRLVCTNGLRIGKDIFRIRRKHTSGLIVDEVLNNALMASKMFFDKTVPRYQELYKTEVENVSDFLESLKERKKIPVRLVDKITDRIATKSFTNQWDIYNEFTSYLSHDYKKSVDRREELQKVVATAFGI